LLYQLYSPLHQKLYNTEHKKRVAVKKDRRFLNRASEHSYNGVHAFVFPPHGAAAISCCVPITWTRHMKSSSILLHYHTGHNIFERFIEFWQLSNRLFDYAGRPLVHWTVLIIIIRKNAIHTFFCNGRNFFHNESGFNHYCAKLARLSAFRTHMN